MGKQRRRDGRLFIGGCGLLLVLVLLDFLYTLHSGGTEAGTMGLALRLALQVLLIVFAIVSSLCYYTGQRYRSKCREADYWRALYQRTTKNGACPSTETDAVETSVCVGT